MNKNRRKAPVTQEELDQVWQAYRGKGEMQYTKYMLYSMAMAQGIDIDSLRDKLTMEWLLNNMLQAKDENYEGDM